MAAMRNRKNLQPSCGCYKCLAVFPTSEIVQWTDGGETAICPKCSADTILMGLTDVELLKGIQKFWFA
jgi:NAD-dependent SIR2 family protein deacetylase